MTITIATHSYKGGTGKTIFTVNLATLLAKLGSRVVVLDLDLSAPSVYTFIPENLRIGVADLNQVLLKDIPLEQALIDATDQLIGETEGKLWFGLASHQTEAIMKITRRNVKEYSDDASKLFNWISLLSEEPYNADYIVIDTSPGMSFAAVNCVAAADIALILLRIINADLEGTRDMVKGLHSKLGVEMKFLANQIPNEFFINNNSLEKIGQIIKTKIIDEVNSEHAEFAGIIPRDPEIVQLEINSILEEGHTDARRIHIINDKKKVYQSKFTESLINLIKIIEARKTVL
jgi:cellulose biosynthesis protein BcsQ